MSAQEDKRKHLDFVQLTITRMAANSFLLKAWGVTLVAALFALAAKDAKAEYWIVAYIPIFAFWSLDAYYLHQEKLFRKLYDVVRKTEPSKITFSLDTNDHTGQVDSWIRCLIRPSLAIFYGTIAAVLVAIILVTK